MRATSDPAEWARASHSPDFGAKDSLEDVLREIATRRLKHLPEKDRARVVDAVTAVAMQGIEEGKRQGLLHDGDDVTWTPQFYEMLAHIFAELLDSKNTRLTAQCFDYAFGLGLQMGVSEKMIAEQHGMTRSNVSKMCVAICDKYHVPPSRGMRSLATRKTYANRQRGRRAKPTADTWIHQDALLLAFTNGPAA